MFNSDVASVYTDFDGLAKLKQGAKEQTPEAIKQVAKQFESVFLNMVLKSMRQAKLAEGALDSKQSEFYRDMYDQQIALHLSGKPGVGLADLIAKQLTPKQKSADEKNMQAGDYLNRAFSTGRQVVEPVVQPTTKAPYKPDFVSPLDDSGLSRLEESLARLERSQRAFEFQGQGGEAGVNKQLFMSQLLPYAQQAAGELGVDANVLLAQAALETGWGQSVIKNTQGESSFNLFNIKADKSWQGKQTRVSTLEYDGGVTKRQMAGFRSYGSFRESFDDYVDFIKSNPRYSEALRKANNPAHYVRELQKAGYATDPRYAEKVMSIYNSQTAGQMQAKAV